MNTLFEETSINGMVLKNRLVRSATWEGMCEKDGRPTKKIINCYKTLAEGGVGLIITGYAFIRPDGKQLPGMMGIHTDKFSEEMKAITREVHNAGGKISIQLVHAGGQTDYDTIGTSPIAPSGVHVAQYQETPKQMSRQDIDEIIDAFGKSAQRAKAYGFDAVELHAAHGYLINQFLSPLTNQRTDEYGGNIENRCRFLMNVYNEVRTAVGNHFPIMVKINGSDNMDGGLQIIDAVHASKILDKAGIDAIEVSAGTAASAKDQGPIRSKINSAEREGYNIALAETIKKNVNCPVMVVGGFRSFEVASKAVSEKNMDYIAMARPLIMKPDLPNLWQSGDHSRAKCVSCNKCFKPGLKKEGIYCVVLKKKH